MLTHNHLVVFTAVLSLLIVVSADDSLTLIQKKCKLQKEAVQEKEMKGEDNCPEYKILVQCIAKVNFTAVNSFVTGHKPANCEFTDKDIRDLQKYSISSTQAIPTTTEYNTAAGLSMMPILIGMALILQPVILNPAPQLFV